MGAEPYWYYTDYQTDLNLALDTLRKREFQAGRYNPAIPLLDFPITESSPSPGAQHPSIEAALEASDAANAFWHSIDRGTARYITHIPHPGVSQSVITELDS